MTRARGVSIAVVLLVLLVMSVIGMGVATMGVQNLEHAQANRDGARALYAAQAGIAAALLQLKQNRSWNAGLPWTDLPGDTSGYTVAVTNNIFSKSSTTLVDGVSIPPGTAYLLAEGRSSPSGIRRRVGLLVGNVTSAFQQAVFGSNEVSLAGGATTDAFDSNLGPYATSLDPHGGDIVTNATSAGAVSIQGSSTRIDGSVVVGAGGNPTTVVSGSSSAYQSSFAMDQSVPVEPVTVPQGTSQGNVTTHGNITLSPGIYGDLSASAGGQVTLTSGVYVFHSLTLRGNAQIAVDASQGPVTVYISGDGNDSTTDLDISGGGLVNPSMKATDLLILMGPQATSAKLTGGSESYYAVYGPNADITVTGGSAIYGSVAGRQVDITGGAQLHYDEALRKVTTGPSYLQKLGWQED